MTTEDLLLNHAKALQKAIRVLREDLKITQVQLSNAVGLTPTSIYRYEAGDSFPDTSVLVTLWDFALRNGSYAAGFFSDLLAQTMPPLKSLLEKFSTNQEEGIHAARSQLKPDDRLLVTAFLEMLNKNRDEKALRIIGILLEPWIDAAKKELSQELSLSARVSTTNEGTLPVSAQRKTKLASIGPVWVPDLRADKSPEPKRTPKNK